MAVSIQDFLLRFKTSGVGDINKASNAVKTLGNDIAAFGNQSGAFSNSINGIIGKLGPMGTAAAVAGGAFVALGLKAIALADELGDISDATGIGAGALNNLKNSLVDAGGKADDFSNLAAKLNQNVGEAAVGGEKAQKAFQQLGVYVTDAGGKVRNTGDILRDAIAKLAAIEDPATRAAMAVDLFGKSANKLDFTKLNAANDFAKDEQVAQLAKYQTAIDNIAKSINDNLLTAFGKLAIAYNNYNNQIDANEKKLNEQGRTTRPFSMGGPSVTMNLPAQGSKLTERAMTEEEKAYVQSLRTAESMQADHNREMSRLKKIGAESGGAGGGFGAVPEATLKAIAESRKRLAASNIESEKNEKLKSANEIQAIEINAQAELRKAANTIYAQERISNSQMDAEYAAKKVEIETKAAGDIAKVRNQLNARIFSEEEAQRQAGAEALAAQQKQFEGAAKTARDRADAFQQTREDLEDQIMLEETLRGMGATQANTQREIAAEIKKRTDAIKELGNIENLTYEDRLKQEERIRADSVTNIELIRKRGEDEVARQQNFMSGWEDAWSAYKDNAMKYSEQAKSSFDNALTGLEDAFVRAVQTGKLSFKDLANSIIADLARIAFKRAVMSIGSAFFGIPIPGMATGGPVMANSPYIVGEKGPELFVPKSAGNIIPNGGSSSGGSSAMGSTMVTYNIQAVDAQSFRSLVARDPSFIYAVTEQGRRSQPTRSR